jgi:hypothetical protein
LCQNLASLGQLPPSISLKLRGRCAEFDRFGSTFYSWNWLASRWNYIFLKRQALVVVRATHAFFVERPSKYYSHFQGRCSSTCPRFLATFRHDRLLALNEGLKDALTTSHEVWQTLTFLDWSVDHPQPIIVMSKPNLTSCSYYFF